MNAVNAVYDIPMRNIEVYSEADVLCGRGGAAQKHVGNKTYRALVNLNKQLYASCRTTEKIKISRSIVAAIREQKGRFLEKQDGSELFYDIGDKKAVEKTSQALREGQPKLKKKLAKSDGDTPTTQASAERGVAVGIAAVVGIAVAQYHPPPVITKPAPLDNFPPQELRMDDYNQMNLRTDPNHAQPPPPVEHHWVPTEAVAVGPVSRPLLPPGGESQMSVMSDISGLDGTMMAVQRAYSQDGSFRDQLQHISVPDHPFPSSFDYDDDDDDSDDVEMNPLPPRAMVEVRMDSFRRAMLGIASPQNSTMSLMSTNSHYEPPASAMEEAQSNPIDVNVGQQPQDIVAPVRPPADSAAGDVPFRGRARDAIDDLLSVGGLSKLSLMSGISDRSLDTGFIGGVPAREALIQGISETTLDSAFSRNSSRFLSAQSNRALSTRSAAMSDLGMMAERDNEDDEDYSDVFVTGGAKVEL
jgi:hypothetical protein